MNAIDWVNQKFNKERAFPNFKAGDTVKVHVKIREGEKERIQVYEGVVIRIHRNGPGSSFTVRKISYGVGVERIFSFSTPSIDKVELVKEGRVRRAKLYYLRELSGKKARIRTIERFGDAAKQVVKPEEPKAEAPVAEAKAEEVASENTDNKE